jgi:uncharacterized membrane protein
MEPFLIKDLIHTGIDLILSASGWMGWNMFLAVIPLYLSLYLFREPAMVSDRRQVIGTVWLRQRLHDRIPQSLRQSLWSIGVLIFIAFLPNAPYILTDVIHLNRFILEYNSLWVTGFLIAPMFLVFIGTGFLTYVLSLINVGYYLHKRGQGRWIPAVELTLHLLCAIGVFVGRFPRLNSWHFVTQPGRVIVTLLGTLFSPTGILGITIGFMIITALYVPSKEIVLALVSYRKKRSTSAI